MVLEGQTAIPVRRRHCAPMGGQLDAAELHRAKLLGSERVNNAVLHGQGRIELRAELNDDRVRIEVIDEGEGFRELHGRGLGIVDAEASRLGDSRGHHPRVV
jgi:anti-sigma regulatory factor (Ser/Thr protein kinase)